MSYTKEELEDWRKKITWNQENAEGYAITRYIKQQIINLMELTSDLEMPFEVTTTIPDPKHKNYEKFMSIADYNKEFKRREFLDSQEA